MSTARITAFMLPPYRRNTEEISSTNEALTSPTSDTKKRYSLPAR